MLQYHCIIVCQVVAGANRWRWRGHSLETDTENFAHCMEPTFTSGFRALTIIVVGIIFARGAEYQYSGTRCFS
jgi:hypothetical protein